MRLLQNLRSARTVKSLCVISMFLFAGVVMAKDFWETTIFDQWSQKECQKMLTDSPWVKELNLQGQNFGFSSAAAIDGQAPYVKYTVQIRSAAPVRQAVVRQAQINNQYDSLSDDQKRAFDRSMESFLIGPDPELIVVHISFATNNRDNIQNLNRHWETQTTDLLRNSVFLRGGSKGEKVPIAQFIPGSSTSQEFQFIFPREVEGKELLKPGDKVLQLDFAYPVVGGLGDGRGFMEFRTDKMKLNNEVIY
jgi:hypothetical protein